jgi:hypothetical protein
VQRFIRKGVERIRITGGEPLVRRNVVSLIEALGSRLGVGLKELTLTTNGSQLVRFARPLYAAGMRRINVSLDTRDPENSGRSPAGASSRRCSPASTRPNPPASAVKINMVALKGINEDEIETMLEWAHGRGMDLTLIETMPMGEIDGDRVDQYLPLSLVRARLAQQFTLDDIDYRTGGPARYVRVAERAAARLHHPADAQFLRELQPRAAHLHRHALYVPRPVRRRRPAHPAARVVRRRPAGCSDRLGDRAQAEGPRFCHRSPARASGAGAAHVADGRLTMEHALHFVASDSPDAQAALAKLRARYGDVGPEEPRL